jgi:hypothetical protein
MVTEGSVVDVDNRQRPRVSGVGQRFADEDLRHAGDGDDFARSRFLSIYAVEGLGDVELGHLHALHAPVEAAPRDHLPFADCPVLHAAERYAADVKGGVQVGDEGLEGVILIVRGRRDGPQERLE